MLFRFTRVGLIIGFFSAGKNTTVLALATSWLGFVSLKVTALNGNQLVHVCAPSPQQRLSWLCGKARLHAAV